MQKSAARKLFLQKRRDIALREKAMWDDLILIQFQKLLLPPLHAVFTYAAMDAQMEISTEPIIAFLRFRNPGLQVAYPICDFDTNVMRAAQTHDEAVFEINRFGIPEPKDCEILQPGNIDLILIPLLCFDREGYRVGYGKGFYDRFLPFTRTDCIKIGLSYFDPVDRITDRDEFDVPLDYCITPQQVYEF